jgi:hypothetical protein
MSTYVPSAVRQGVDADDWPGGEGTSAVDVT